MARHREDLGARKQVRVDLYKQGFLIPAPDAPWIECLIVDVSDSGVCLEVGALAVPILLVGSDDAAEGFIREMRRSANAPFAVLGILDHA